MTIIQQNTFSGCSSLMNVSFPSSLTNIEERAFYYCDSLSKISLLLLSELGELSFAETNLIELKIPDSITQGAFSFCKSLRKIFIPSFVVKICKGSFQYCTSLEQITIERPSLLAFIDECAFMQCRSLTQFDLPDSVNEIGPNTF